MHDLHACRRADLSGLFWDALFAPRAYACLNAIVHTDLHIAPVTGANVGPAACRPAVT